LIWSAPVLAALAGATAAAGLVRGFSGFGAGLLMAPIFIYLVGPATAVPAVVVLDLAASVMLLPSSARHTRWRTIMPLGIAAAIAIPAGGWALTSLSREVLLRTVSGVVLVFVAALGLGWRYRSRPALPVTAAAGAASGFLTGMGGIGGPPIILFLLSGPGTARENRAGFIAFFAITQVIALATFAAAGVMTRALLPLASLLVPIFLIAIGAGTRLFSVSNEATYRRVALAFLAGVGLAGLLLN